MSSKGYRWYNNGKIQICIRFDKDPPEGFVRGCLQHSERQNKEHSEYLKNAYASGKLVNPRKGIKETPEQIEAKRLRATGRPMSEEAKRKLSQTNKGKKKPEGFGKKVSDRMKGKPLPEEVKQKLSKALKGRPIRKEILEERNRKQFETKRKKGTLNSSKSEELYFNCLKNIFGEDVVKRQYNEGVRYPFFCDFYISSLDLFIELNLFRTHGPHPYGIDITEDERIVKDWKAKQKTYINSKGLEVNNQYYMYEKVFTESDPRKISYVKENNLNCLLIYPEEILLYHRGELLIRFVEQKSKKFLYDFSFLEAALQRLASINGWTVIQTEEGLNELYKADGTKVAAEELTKGTEKLMRYYYIQQWNGILPETIAGEDNVMALIGLAQ